MVIIFHMKSSKRIIFTFCTGLNSTTTSRQLRKIRKIRGNLECSLFCGFSLAHESKRITSITFGINTWLAYNILFEPAKMIFVIISSIYIFLNNPPILRLV